MRKPKHLSRSSDRKVAKLDFPLPPYKACFILLSVSGDLTGQAVVSSAEVKGERLGDMGLRQTFVASNLAGSWWAKEWPRPSETMFKCLVSWEVFSSPLHINAALESMSPRRAHIKATSLPSAPEVSLCPARAPVDSTSGRRGLQHGPSGWLVSKPARSRQQPRGPTPRKIARALPVTHLFWPIFHFFLFVIYECHSVNPVQCF